MDSDRGEFQTISSMLVKATELELKAVLYGKFFNRACIFGYLRVIKNGISVYPYRLEMDFIKRTTKFFKGKQTVLLEKYMPIVKDMLLNPETITF